MTEMYVNQDFISVRRRSDESFYHGACLNHMNGLKVLTSKTQNAIADATATAIATEGLLNIVEYSVRAPFFRPHLRLQFQPTSHTAGLSSSATSIAAPQGQKMSSRGQGGL